MWHAIWSLFKKKSKINIFFNETIFCHSIGGEYLNCRFVGSIVLMVGLWYWNSFCHDICVVISDFKVFMEFFVVPLAKMHTKHFATQLLNWIWNSFCRFYNFWKIKFKFFFGLKCHVFKKQRTIQIQFVKKFQKVKKRKKR